MSDSFDQLKSVSVVAVAAAQAAAPAPPRRLLTRVVVPGGLLLALLLVLGWSSRLWWQPVIAVKVEPVIVRAGSEGAEVAADGGKTHAPHHGEAVAKAAGWIEPDPYPVYASALAPGTIESVKVLDGQTVAAGDPVAELVKADADIALRQAAAETAGAQAKVAAAQARVVELSAIEAQLPAETAAMEADLAALRDKAARLEAARAGGAVVEAEVVQQKLAVAAKAKSVEVLQADAPARAARVTVAKAEAKAASADLAAAGARQEAAQLRMERMTVRASASGVVMRLLKSPGEVLDMNSSMPRAMQVAALYDPKHLQVRVDVPLSLAAKVRVGQACEVVAEVLPERKFSGKVTRFVHEADLQKNTVQVKVSIEDPASELKPEMLATAQFFAIVDASGSAGLQARSGSSGLQQVFIHPDWLVVRHDTHGIVWVARPIEGGLAEAVETNLQLGQASADGFVHVLAGLSPGDRVVVSPKDKMKDGARLKVAD